MDKNLYMHNRDFALCRLQDKGFTLDDIAGVLKKIPFVSCI